MYSKTGTPHATPLSQTLPEAKFGEHHCGIVEAPPDAVWQALQQLRWTDLTIGRPLIAVRGLNTPLHRDRLLETFTLRAGAALVADAPHSTTLAMVGKPWSLIPQHVRVETLDAVERFTEPGWLKYGMEWLLHPLPGRRTLVETRTLCEATDASARRAFRLYWTLIRAFSGALRLDIIAALRRSTAHPNADPCVTAEVPVQAAGRGGR